MLSAQQQAAVQQNLSNIEFVVSERSAQVRACYQRILQAMPTPPSGRVTVSLTLTDEGRAEAIENLRKHAGQSTAGRLSVAAALRVGRFHAPCSRRAHRARIASRLFLYLRPKVPRVAAGYDAETKTTIPTFSPADSAGLC